MLNINDKVPDFKLIATNNISGKLSDFKGKNIILYFYPKDDTPGCTLEAQTFRDHIDEFKKLNTVILGISKDPMKSHEKFRAKHCLPFDLIEDQDGTICALFDTWKEKSMYGRKYMGIDRSTFLIDSQGVLKQEWRGVKVPGHIEAVLKAIQTL